MSLAENFAVEIILEILPGIFNVVKSQAFLATVSSASKDFSFSTKNTNQIISFKTFLDILVFSFRHMSAIHDVKIGKSLVSVVCFYQIAN